MKKITSLLSIMALTAVFSTSALAQSAPATVNSANTTTTIVAPIGITTTTALNFGSFATLSTGGTLVMTPAAVRSSTGGVKLTSATGSPAAAAFAVSGEGAYAYTITLPTSALELTTVATGTGLKTMSVASFVSSIGTSGTLVSGSQAFTVGATLTVGLAQAVGTYVNSGGFAVTVNYN
ncbi:DUF4402 domain-containing protein [Flavobacterium sp. LB2P53]|uniref:DUF4402 domain-containing protein n=1 Tax=Flavobacterium sp. LB2P53 TaxID=2497481 RepID=UPI000F82F9B5|nr:DUF4402 domain-containing protein [Flavobacterium sp. LB2P53]RTY69546.1 DUF4402 domain-containing protein [Flavobacterium sp. LB2P53]